jgi:hypothetical protein
MSISDNVVGGEVAVHASRRAASGSAQRLAWLASVASISAMSICADVGCSSRGTSDDASARPAVPARLRLDRSLHPLARRELDVGPLDPQHRLENVSLVFRSSPEQAAAREALRAAQLDPASPSYHAWLTPSEYRARFGASDDDVARTTAWLRTQGLDVQTPSPLATRVIFAGTAEQIGHAFQTDFRR